MVERHRPADISRRGGDETIAPVSGEDDPIFPLGHAEALVREIPGGELLVLGQAGHLLARAIWDTAVPAMLAHTSGIPTGSRSRDAAD